jgi:hypothetical protein
MITSQSRTLLSNHTVEPIPVGTLGYMRARAKRRVFTILLTAFEKSGMTRAQLARRLEMDKSLLSRYLGKPANWEFETLCDFFFAITGDPLKWIMQGEIDELADQSFPIQDSAMSVIQISAGAVSSRLYKLDIAPDQAFWASYQISKPELLDVVPIINTDEGQFAMTGAH